MGRKQRWVLLVFAGMLTDACGPHAREEPKVEHMEVRKLWDKARHNALTDLLRFKERWYCVLREGENHRSSDGALRVLTSWDGEEWASAALIAPKPGRDLRDPHITIAPDDRLMLIAADRIDKEFHTAVWFSSDGENWSDSVLVGEPDIWLWRVTWHEGVAYGVGYAFKEDPFVRLYKSSDGIHFDVLVERLFDRGYPSETSIVFTEDGSAYCLLRRDGEEENTAQLGIAQPPYKDWSWKDLGVRVGGPQYAPLTRWAMGCRRASLWRTAPNFTVVARSGNRSVD